MKEMISIALPKGRLGDRVYRMFAKAGYPNDEIEQDGRKLVFESPQSGVRYFLVKPADVHVYVERGAADIGVCGKDILLEYAPDVYELLDLKTGTCRMAVAPESITGKSAGRSMSSGSTAPSSWRRYCGFRMSLLTSWRQGKR